MMTGSLQLTGVHVVAGQHRLLHQVSLHFHAGQVTAVAGPSGSGKTTLLFVTGGLIPPTHGEAAYGERPMWTGTGEPRPEVAFVLQGYGLVPILSVRENVSLALRARDLPPNAAGDRADRELARLGIAHLSTRQVDELSGGQMQRLAVARALAVEPEILLADEPTSELDGTNRSLVLNQLHAHARRGATVVVASHDPAVIEASDRVVHLAEGRVGTP